MKAADPATRVVSVAGKDRSAVLMGGHKVDEMWWWDRNSFVTYAGRPTPPVVTRANKAVADEIARAQPPLELPDFCRAKRSEEHTSELQSLMRISYAVFCLKQKKTKYK